MYAQAPASNAVVCSALEAAPIKNEAPRLSVVCGRYGVTLGSVDRYELVQFPALDAAVVVTTFEGTQRVFLLIKNPDESVALEELTSAITLELGRGVRSTIVGFRLDFENAAMGRMVATDASAEAKGAPPVAIDIAAMIAQSRSMRGPVKFGVAP